MSNKREVSEKTLELNVCAELIRCIRAHKGCEKAVWIGMTQKEERDNGLDAMIENAPGFALLLQFKSPKPSSTYDDHYKFTINRLQHETFLKIDPRFLSSVFYAFPFYSKWIKVCGDSPCLLQDTWLVPVQCVSLNGRADQQSFQIDLTRISSPIRVDGASLSVNCKAINAKKRFCDSTSGPGDLSIFEGIPTETLQDWVRAVDESGTRFTGLNAIHVARDPTVRTVITAR